MVWGNSLLSQYVTFIRLTYPSKDCHNPTVDTTRDNCSFRLHYRRSCKFKRCDVDNVRERRERFQEDDAYQPASDMSACSEDYGAMQPDGRTLASVCGLLVGARGGLCS